jgi:hypothetical protein
MRNQRLLASGSAAPGRNVANNSSGGEFFFFDGERPVFALDAGSA